MFSLNLGKCACSCAFGVTLRLTAAYLMAPDKHGLQGLAGLQQPEARLSRS